MVLSLQGGVPLMLQQQQVPAQALLLALSMGQAKPCPSSLQLLLSTPRQAWHAAYRVLLSRTCHCRPLQLAVELVLRLHRGTWG